MELIGSLLKQTVKYRKQYVQKNRVKSYHSQNKTLKRLLEKAKNTKFGVTYNFQYMLNCSNTDQLFEENVPYFNYEKMHREFWFKTLQGEKNITWPGKIKYFAKTSGTSNGASKRIPVSLDMVQCIRKTGLSQMLAMNEMQLPPEFYKKQILFLGGSTKLESIENHYEGDLSGILAKKIPFWFSNFSKPGKKISGIKDWDEKLDAIVKAASKWDIGIISGVPAWMQHLLEKIIDHYGLESIHDIWPNLKIYVHGGVAFEPYKKGIEKLFEKEVFFLDTYLASEGFLAYENRLQAKGMQLNLKKGIYFEFVPFDENHFDAEGNILPQAKPVPFDELEKNKDYAVVISTCSGLWRYLIGDTIRFTSLLNYEIKITGRTKHFLNLCGEHLSVDNMTTAIQEVAKTFAFDCKEFCVAGIKKEQHVEHHWYLSTNKKVNNSDVAMVLDHNLKTINDDYTTERQAIIQKVKVKVLPEKYFYGFMEQLGKKGGQNKFPRVMNEKQLREWKLFLHEMND